MEINHHHLRAHYQSPSPGKPFSKPTALSKSFVQLSNIITTIMIPLYEYILINHYMKFKRKLPVEINFYTLTSSIPAAKHNPRKNGIVAIYLYSWQWLTIGEWLKISCSIRQPVLLSPIQTDHQLKISIISLLTSSPGRRWLKKLFELLVYSYIQQVNSTEYAGFWKTVFTDCVEWINTMSALVWFDCSI